VSQLLDLPLEKIIPSSTNPRRTFDQASMDEITESIKTHGVAQPILVRPHPNQEGFYELIAGERRWRGSKAADKPRIPAYIRNLSDVEALELQVIENLHRKDLHPMEEAEGYQRLMKEHGFSIEQLIEKVGKSRAYIYARLKLCSLCDKARQAFYDGVLNPSTALLIARIPVAALQAQAMKDITEGHQGPLAVRAAQEVLQRRYMLKLAEAPFPRGDATLIPKAGKCHECPKRTGNQPEVFEDIKSADVCTDPDCFSKKKDTYAKQVIQQGLDEGKRILSIEDTRRYFPHGIENSYSGSFISFNEKNWSLGKTVRELVGDAKFETLHWALDQNTGKLVEVVKRSEYKAVLVQRGLSKSSGSSDKEREKAARVETRYREQIHTTVREKLLHVYENDPHLSKDEYVLLAKALFDRTDFENQKRLSKLWTPDCGPIGSGHDLVHEFKQTITTLPHHKLCLLVMDLVVIVNVKASSWNYDRDEAEMLMSVAKQHNINTTKIRKEIEATTNAKKPAKKPEPASA